MAAGASPCKSLTIAIGPVLSWTSSSQRIASSTFFCQIETAEGVENAEAIAALPGVDCLWVGHFDLSVSLGVPGEFNAKTVTDAIARVCEATRKHGKSLGRLVPTVQQGIDLFGQGFRLHLLFGRRLGAARCAEGRDR